MLLDLSEMRRGQPLTARQWPTMLGYSARAEGSVVVVEGRDGTSARSNAPDFEATLNRMIGRSIALHEDTSGDNHDDSDVLVINLASVRALSQEYGSQRDPLRFRPNIMLDGDEAVPFDELAWPGKRFRVGDLELEAVKMDQRCVMTTIDPQTIEVDPGFLRFVVQKHGGVFGVYCRVAQPGTVRDGDAWTEIA